MKIAKLNSETAVMNFSGEDIVLFLNSQAACCDVLELLWSDN
jgi:hypothetical protein